MKPVVSIIIPTLNRSATLHDTLVSLASLDHDAAAYEILVVDNGSTDYTGELVDRFISSTPSHRIRYYYEPEPGLLSGRHKGALKAKGDILVFIDDDIIADAGWLNAIVRTFEDPTVHLVGGPSLPKYETAPPEWLEIFWFRNGAVSTCGSLSLQDQGSKIIEVDPTWVWGLNFAIRKSTLFETGGFHPDSIPKHLQRFQGDGETGLSLKIRQRGLKAVYQPEALVYHQIPAQRLTIEYFEDRMFFQGVCDSYTKIREPHFNVNAKNQRNGLDWKLPLRKARQIGGRIYRKLTRDPYAEIRRRIQDAYRAGFAFHQNEVANDPELLKWVLKPDYWDYKLPRATEMEDGR